MSTPTIACYRLRISSWQRQRLLLFLSNKARTVVNSTLQKTPWNKFSFWSMPHKDKHTRRLPASSWNVYTCKKYLFNWELQMDSPFLLVSALLTSWQTNTPCRVTAGTTLFHRNARSPRLFVSSSREETSPWWPHGRKALQSGTPRTSSRCVRCLFLIVILLLMDLSPACFVTGCETVSDMNTKKTQNTNILVKMPFNIDIKSFLHYRLSMAQNSQQINSSLWRND